MSANHTYSFFGFFDSIIVSFCYSLILYMFCRQRVISVFFVSSVSIIISIIFSISFSYISTLRRHHKLIKGLVVHELDIWSKLQGSGDAASCTSVWQQVNTMIEQQLVPWYRCTMLNAFHADTCWQQSGAVNLNSVVKDKHPQWCFYHIRAM